MVGGLLLSQALTLFTTPVIYLHLDRLRGRSRKPVATGQLAGATHSAPAFPG
jgi:hypothetical protein